MPEVSADNGKYTVRWPIEGRPYHAPQVLRYGENWPVMNPPSNVLLAFAIKAQELDRLAARLGEGSDPFAAWESLEALIAAARKLAIAAQTTGGTAGPDQGLMAAIAEFGEMVEHLGSDPL